MTFIPTTIWASPSLTMVLCLQFRKLPLFPTFKHYFMIPNTSQAPERGWSINCLRSLTIPYIVLRIENNGKFPLFVNIPIVDLSHNKEMCKKTPLEKTHFPYLKVQNTYWRNQNVWWEIIAQWGFKISLLFVLLKCNMFIHLDLQYLYKEGFSRGRLTSNGRRTYGISLLFPSVFEIS